jgi:hypothetical protein
VRNGSPVVSDTSGIAAGFTGAVGVLPAAGPAAVFVGARAPSGELPCGERTSGLRVGVSGVGVLPDEA